MPEVARLEAAPLLPPLEPPGAFPPSSPSPPAASSATKRSSWPGPPPGYTASRGCWSPAVWTRCAVCQEGWDGQGMAQIELHLSAQLSPPAAQWAQHRDVRQRTACSTLSATSAHPAALPSLTAGVSRLARPFKRLRVCPAGSKLRGCATGACKAGASAELRHEEEFRDLRNQAETGRMLACAGGRHRLLRSLV